MGDVPNKPKTLLDKLISSKNITTNSLNNTHINNIAESKDNVINELSICTQSSDNTSNHPVIAINNEPEYNINNKNNTYEHIQSVPNTNPILNQNSHSNTINKKSFAETTLNEIFPKKEQAIVFDSIDNIPQIDYVIAISKLIPPKNIKYVSRISNNRFCIYLNDKNSVDYLIDNHPNIEINDHTIIKLRRLINPAKRIIISNVSPAIPNHNIKTLLQEHNIQLLSPITHINAGFNIKELAHILSFRRQVYINPEDYHKLPNSALINHDNTPHRIFLTDDTIFCYKCKLTGHTAKQCKNTSNETPIINTTLQHEHTNPIKNQENENHQSTHHDPSSEVFIENPNDTHDMITTKLTQPPAFHDTTEPTHLIKSKNETINTNKRPALVSTSSSSTNETSPPSPIIQNKNTEVSIPPKNKTDKIPQTTKKIKRSNSIEQIITKLEENLEPAKTHFEENNKSKINFNQLKYIIENTLSNSNPITVLEPFNITCLEMIGIIDIIRPKIKNLSIKNRLTRLCNALLNNALSDDPPTSQ